MMREHRKKVTTCDFISVEQIGKSLKRKSINHTRYDSNKTRGLAARAGEEIKLSIDGLRGFKALPVV